MKLRRLIILVSIFAPLSACDIGDLLLPAGSRGAATPAVAPAEPADPYRTLVLTVARVAGAREITLLKPLVTRRLAGDLEEVMRTHRDRFWNHLDVIRKGVQGGFTMPAPVKRDDGRLELPLKFTGGGEATLIVRHEDGQPRIDRF